MSQELQEQSACGAWRAPRDRGGSAGARVRDEERQLEVVAFERLAPRRRDRVAMAQHVGAAGRERATKRGGGRVERAERDFGEEPMRGVAAKVELEAERLLLRLALPVHLQDGVPDAPQRSLTQAPKLQCEVLFIEGPLTSGEGQQGAPATPAPDRPLDRPGLTPRLPLSELGQSYSYCWAGTTSEGPR
jgi:hypothetical protein